MARVINAAGSTLIGTPKQLDTLFRLLVGTGSAVIDLSGSNMIALDKPITPQQFKDALRIVPGKTR